MSYPNRLAANNKLEDIVHSHVTFGKGFTAEELIDNLKEHMDAVVQNARDLAYIEGYNEGEANGISLMKQTGY